MTKPFSVRELIGRVRAQLRRRELDRSSTVTEAKTIEAGPCKIDLARHLVSIRGEPVNLTRSEFQVLRLLAERPGQVFSRLEIMEELWQSEFSGDVRACDVHISNLRQKVERDPQEPELVLTVRGVGYKLAEQVVSAGARPLRALPTGELHLGNLRTALLAWLFAARPGRLPGPGRGSRHGARARGARASSSTTERDRPRLGRRGRAPVRARRALRAALASLTEAGLTYRCFCSRREIREAAPAPTARPRAPTRGRAARRHRGGPPARRRRGAVRDPPARRGRRGPVRGPPPRRATGVVDDLVLRRATAPSPTTSRWSSTMPPRDRRGRPRRRPARVHAGQALVAELLGLPRPESRTSRSCSARMARGSRSATAPSPCATSARAAGIPPMRSPGWPPPRPGPARRAAGRQDAALSLRPGGAAARADRVQRDADPTERRAGTPGRAEAPALDSAAVPA